MSNEVDRIEHLCSRLAISPNSPTGLVWKGSGKKAGVLHSKRTWVIGKDRIPVDVLVWTISHGSIPDGMSIYHLDTNKKNNSLENLILIDNEDRRKNKLVKSKKLVCGVGINDSLVAQSWYNSEGKVVIAPTYRAWHSMLVRCYSERHLDFYSDVTVYEPWKSFSVFEKWHINNYVDGWHLDKDILNAGNRIYSPTNCSYVPGFLNMLLTARSKLRGDHPLGVSFCKRGMKFVATISGGAKSKSKHLGYFKTPQEAHQAWQWAKAEQIEKVLNKYAKEPFGFRTDVADALVNRIWQLRLNHSNYTETVTL